MKKFVFSPAPILNVFQLMMALFGRLRDGDGRGALALDGGGAADDLRPERIGDRRASRERHQRRGRQQQLLQTP